MNNLQNHLEALIRQNGPMDIAAFMTLALGHYYSTRDPFGKDGDFTTAPEISQMFGEMIGAFLADAWMKTGSPPHFDLVEAGPGRGTLMADILRATATVPGFHAAAHVHLIEMSPVLKEAQRRTLKDYAVQWHESFDTLGQQSSCPMFFVANEFLDALPIHQYVRQNGAWFERVVGMEGDAPVFGLRPSVFTLDVKAEDGAVWEISPAREGFAAQVARHLRKNGGVALFIDYGHDRSGFGDTLQAVKNHRFADVLRDVGEADLTSHVDFESIRRAAAPHAMVHGPVGQGDFLNALGIGLRAGRLNQPEEYRRLTAPDQMGTLFRVMALCHDPDVKLEGFDQG
ncbi:MAG: SAM-dependent methyltransferase [Micavibrio aeruginosavorus]|nr:SAM-dependent methyltransferase [Micavibrio aeruginosavorus]